MARGVIGFFGQPAADWHTAPIASDIKHGHLILNFVITAALIDDGHLEMLLSFFNVRRRMLFNE